MECHISTRIWELLASNLGPETYLSWLSSFHDISRYTATFIHILSKPLLINHPIIRYCALWTIDDVIE
jgi:hypothetical protein